ncbi:choline dehydrogenase-like flavoprotein [Pseudonocardia hierapolitana]|uniref:Choline dehydrogenase-like flavoprotein n=1 Tax=Pseudonocardia hierapolitana TaxID=1128676 RepID=A0A561SZN9_9PSEU|nr:family 16 glycoside hydrolase [Pseudonocardia hierapolitana]TWF80317.1 choline dehydrogenase-like flavoprotein [Pseudonocardia hierapolitana]
MPTSPRPQRTDFSIDIPGRYVCNGLDEAMMSVALGGRPFDLIVVGGGSFGGALAQDLFTNDQARVHRILVLEGGPLALPEHVQNMPLQWLGVPPPATSIAQLRSQGLDGQPRAEVWGLAWHSSTPFQGLAYCLGGRSLFFGGWSPQLLDDEMPTAANASGRWPQAVVDDLNNRYFAESAAQIGTEETNDFIFGSLQNALRQTLFSGVNNGAVVDAIPLGNLPDRPVLRGNPNAAAAALRELLGNPLGTAGLSVQELKNLLKLEAPLAVQGQTLPGFFPFNKFSSLPLLMKAARSAQNEANNDTRKRLMVVPNCHVNRLQVQGGRVAAVETNQGLVQVPANGKVIVALGTIESARLALNSFGGLPGAQEIGRNLMAHLRSNLTIRIPRNALANLAGAEPNLQAAALFCKCRHQFAGNDVGHFHMQITAAGLGALGTDSEAELFKKIPDIDTLNRFMSASDTHVVITIRSIGEMEPQNPNSFVGQDSEIDPLFGDQRAFVQLQPTARDNLLWQAMDTAADQTARVFAGGSPYEVQTPNGFVPVQAGQAPSTVLAGPQRHDGLGTTHHEAGTLRMGDDPGSSVTDSNARFHAVANCYALGPALQPTVGSPNPMLTSIALGRRLANHLIPVAPRPGEAPRDLFNGTNLDGWEMAGQGTFVATNGVLQANPGGDLGLLWSTTPAPADFILRCEWRLAQPNNNSGVFIRFPNPNSKGYNNTAYVAVDFGFEIQIDETGAPDGADQHRTGAIYGEPNQAFNLQPALPVGQWNAYEMRVQGQTYTVHLNGVQVTQFNNPSPGRGLPSKPDSPSFVGLQAHTGAVAFRNIQLQAL